MAKINFTNPEATLTISGTNSQLQLGSTLDIGGILQISDQSATSIVQTNTSAMLNFLEQGKILFNGTLYNIYGSYNPNSVGSTIFLTGNQSINFNSGEIVHQSIIVSGPNNTITGAPILLQPISLANENTELNIGLTCKLSNHIYLNEGTLNLIQDLNPKDDIEVIGPGQINFNGYSYNMPYYSRPTNTAPITYNNANDITYAIKTTISNNTNFTGTNNIKGTGVILNFTSGGRYTIANNAILYVNGIHFKGIGLNAGGSFVFNSSTSSMYLTNTTIELSGSFTQTNGKMIVEGTTCKILSDFNDKYIVSGATSIFQVDGQILEYQNVGGLSSMPITTASGGTLSLINNGSIRSAAVPGAKANYEVNLATGTDTNYLDSPMNLGNGSTITFVNATPASAKSMILDANNNTITFGDDSSSCLVLQQNVNLTLQNIKLQNFDPSKISLGASASITYGDNVIFEITSDVSFPSNSLSLTGNTTIQSSGFGAMITLASQAISLTGASKTLTIRGVRTKLSAADGIKINTSSAKLSLQAMNLYLCSPGMTFDTGNLEFADDVQVSGGSQTSPTATVSLTFSSSGIATILSASRLKLNPDIKFVYSPNTALDGGVASVQKRHFKMTDPSSTLQLQHAYIDVGSTGMALDYGKFIIEELANITTTTTAGKEFELGSTVNTMILSAGVLQINGLIKYVPSTYP